ncbi:MAG TPA: tRNA 2-thiouridine(34) synthase MnmA, partial [Firmicutes bacterium]|nr:tRNA 2-thiouridine(34) synthase MnmA [Bacillota bacterium]
MSGGVDSSVTAALLKEQGYEVIGMTMQIWPKSQEDPARENPGGCCSLSAVEDARAVAHILGIPYYVVNLRETFEREVIDYFCREYAAGRTPNPCIVCNHRLKFAALLDKALALGAEYVATGHYARVRYDQVRERYVLLQGVDKHKDQSYALYGLTQKQLAHTLFPLGGFTKEETRRLAAELGLPVALKRDSQEICFVPGNDYRGFLRQRIPEKIRPGPFLDQNGNVVGTHQGLPFYTIGQRRGLGIPGRKRLYVTGLDPERNSVTLGPVEQLFHTELTAGAVNWVSIDRPPTMLAAEVRVRYNGP